jgi:XapX domain-containing protein
MGLVSAAMRPTMGMRGFAERASAGNRGTTAMKIYLVSLAVGVLVGVIYGVLNVRSPAPPVIALIGLLGILLGEQVPPLVRHFATGNATVLGWTHQQLKPHVFGELPKGNVVPASHEVASRDNAGP